MIFIVKKGLRNFFISLIQVIYFKIAIIYYSFISQYFIKIALIIRNLRLVLKHFFEDKMLAVIILNMLKKIIKQMRL
ncbi:hypothetical protein L1276_003732 [Flavobacterium sp. HSC-32F16]|nr:hypothetical protein [Flavobacterium sp. HSC-32F16]